MRSRTRRALWMRSRRSFSSARVSCSCSTAAFTAALRTPTICSRPRAIRSLASPISPVSRPISPSRLALARCSASTSGLRIRPLFRSSLFPSSSSWMKDSWRFTPASWVLVPSTRCSRPSMPSRMVAISLWKFFFLASKVSRWLSTIVLTSGLETFSRNSSGKRTSLSSLISACRRASMATRRRCRSVKRLSSALGTVSSRWMRGWPSLTVSPSRTRMSRMTPPSRCWTILFCPVATKTPDATMAPAIGAVPAHTPKPHSEMATIA